MSGDNVEIKVSRTSRQRQVTLVIQRIANGYVLKAGGKHTHFDTIEALFKATAPATATAFKENEDNA